MIRYLNITRYVIGIVLPLVCIMLGFEYSVIFVILALLILNNTLDDIFFYVGNNEVKDKLYEGGIISPVNGIVTKIEKGTKLFDNIIKEDVLTNVVYMSPFFEKMKENVKYTHISIFLNKLNHHIVVNPFDAQKIYKHYTDGSNEEMVLNGELVSNNKGEYLHNDSVVIDYGKCIVVLTLDKYISDYEVICKEGKKVGVVICKGSQCDIFIPNNSDILCKEGDVLNIYQTIVKGNKEEIKIKYSYIKESIKIGFLHSGGVCKIIWNNILKSFSTFKSIRLSIIVVLGMLLSLFIPYCLYASIIALYCFILERFYKNLMYATMNKIGLKKWMKTSYKQINKLSILWKKR